MTETDHTPAPTDEEQAAATPGHHIPMSAGGWRYSLGDDGLRRGVYVRGQGKHATWQRVAPLPHITTRLTDRDGEGARTNLRYRLTMDLDAPASTATVCDRREIIHGEWAVRLDVPLSADRKILDAVATAIFDAAHHEGVDEAESVPQWRSGHLVMPPADMGPDGYQEYAADEERALEAWREIARICQDNPKLGLCLGAAVGGLYMAPLDRQPFIVDLVGAARRGKSTGLFVGAGALGWAGSPRQPAGVLRAANSSAQGMHQMLRGLSVLPAFADETGTAKRTAAQREEFIMSIAQGDSRTMGERGGLGGKRTPRWSGIYLASGNESLGEGVTNEATWARVLSISTPITATPAAARTVSELVPLGYGWPFQWVMRHPDVDGMRARVARAEHDMPMPDGGVPETIAESLAVIVAGARLVEDMIGLEFAGPVLDEARTVLATMTAELEERGATPADRLMSAVIGSWATHPDTFPTLETYRAAFTKDPLPGDDYPPKMPPVVDGLVLADPPALAVWPNRLGPVSREADITDHNAGVRDLVAEGRMITNPGRRQKKVSITTTVKRWMYLFRLDDHDEGQDHTTEVPTEAPAAVPTEVPNTEVPSSHTEVPTEVPTPAPPTGNLNETGLTCENNGSQVPSSQSSHLGEPLFIEGGPLTGNLSGNRDEGTRSGVGPARPRAVPTPDRPDGAGHVLAATLTPDTLYLAGPGDTVRTEDPGPLVGNLGRLLDWVAGVLPPGGGTIAVDGDAADALGWPYDMERPDDRSRPMVERPRCVEQAAAHGWTTRTVGGWTTWERGQRGTEEFASVTVACLPWMDNRALGTSANLLLDADDDAGSAVYLLARVAGLVGVPYAYTAGSTFAMALRDRYYDRHGQTRRLKGRSRRPMMRLNSDEARGPVCPAFVVPDGGMTWPRPGATDGGAHQDRHVMGLDAIGQHLGTEIGGSFAVDPLTERESIEFDPRIPGLWELAGGAYRLDTGGPPLAGPAATTAGTWWAHTETVKLLIEYGLHSDVFSTRAWVPVNRDGEITRGTQVLRPLAERIRDAIQSIPRTTPDVLEARVRGALKSMYAEAAGELTRHPFVRRPDWSMGIWSGARAQTLRRAVRVWQETGEWPIEIVHDCLYYETGGIGEEFIPAPGVLKYDENRVKLGHVKMDFPNPDEGQAGTMAEYIAKRGGEPKKNTTRRTGRKGGK